MHVRAKQLGLLPRREVPALVEPVVVDQLGISPLGPASRGGVYLVREDANGHRDRNMLGLEEGQLVGGGGTGRRNRRIGEPVERDVVEDIVPGQAFRRAVEGTCGAIAAA